VPSRGRLWQLADTALIATLLFVTACLENRDLPSAIKVPESRPQSAFRIRPEEAAFAALATQSPSSAGFYLDSVGRVTIIVRDIADDEAAQSFVVGLVRTGQIRDSRVREHQIGITRGQYTFHQLAHWRDVVFDNFLGSTPGVFYLDLTERINRVTIGLESDHSTTLRASLPGRLQRLGVDTGAVVFVILDSEDARGPREKRHTTTPAVVALPPSSISHPTYWSDLVGGIYMEGDSESCTLGAVVDQFGSVPGLITVSHCSSDFFGTDGSPAFQPYEGNRQVGQETHDPSGWPCGVLGVNECRRSDASFYSLLPGASSERGLIARTQGAAGPGSGDGSTDIDQARPFFMIIAVDDNDALTGQIVNKMGAYSGWTRGEITGTCVDISTVGFPDTRTVECLYESDMYVRPGDSGGPVFSYYGNDPFSAGDFVTLVGIVKSRTTWLGQFWRSQFSKWGRVIQDLGPMAATRISTLGQPLLSGTMPFLYPVLSWAAVPGATRYHVYRGNTLVATTTGTIIADGQMNVLEYSGATPPSGYGGVEYAIYAANASEASLKSNSVWYRAASGTFSVSITGPSVVGPNNFACSTWVAYVTGAATIVSYAWSGFFTSSEAVVQGTIPQTGAEFQLVVIDSQNRQGGAMKQVTYDANNQDYCEQ